MVRKKKSPVPKRRSPSSPQKNKHRGGGGGPRIAGYQNQLTKALKAANAASNSTKQRVPFLEKVRDTLRRVFTPTRRKNYEGTPEPYPTTDTVRKAQEQYNREVQERLHHYSIPYRQPQQTQQAQQAQQTQQTQLNPTGQHYHMSTNFTQLQPAYSRGQRKWDTYT